MLYRELLDAQWDMGGLPKAEKQLQQLVDVDPVCWRRAWEYVQPKFPVESDGKRRNARLEQIRTG